MHNPYQIMAGVPDVQSVATAVNDAATVNLAAPGEKNRWLILGITISMNGDPTTTPSCTVVSGSTTIERIEFPNAACAPYNTRGVLKGGVNEAVTITLPALGASVRGTVTVRAIKAFASGV
jgi:hypothetical protein